MSEQSHEPIKNGDSSEQKASAEQGSYGSLTVEDDPGGTTDPTDLAGSATSNDAKVGPSANEADDL